MEGHGFMFELCEFMVPFTGRDVQCLFEKYKSRAQEKGLAKEKNKSEDSESVASARNTD